MPFDICKFNVLKIKVMALGQLDQDTKRKLYLSITHGKVVHYLQNGGVEYFKNVEGRAVLPFPALYLWNL